MNPDKEIFHLHRHHIERINEELENLLSSRVSLIEDMGNHALLGHGKRIRPLLFILSTQLCNYQQDDVYLLSTIFEYIHTASLLHDDVLDNARVRRRKPSANHVWGNHAAVLEGDFLYSKSFSVAAQAKNAHFMKQLTETTTQMAEGQVLELIHTDDWDTSEEEYMEVITAKTAVLISAACACGAIISTADHEFVQALGEFGLNSGIAFQLMDDVMDYTSSEEVFGKPVGKDLREGKITLPLIYTLADMNRSERKRLEKLFKDGDAIEQDYRDLVERVRGNPTLKRIQNLAKSYVDEAAKRLGPLPDSPHKKSLLDLSQYIILRKY